MELLRQLNNSPPRGESGANGGRAAPSTAAGPTHASKRGSGRGRGRGGGGGGGGSATVAEGGNKRKSVFEMLQRSAKR